MDHLLIVSSTMVTYAAHRKIISHRGMSIATTHRKALLAGEPGGIGGCGADHGCSAGGTFDAAEPRAICREEGTREQKKKGKATAANLSTGCL